MEDPGIFLSSQVTTDYKKGTDKMLVAFNCQEVNKSTYLTQNIFLQLRNYDRSLSWQQIFITQFHSCYSHFEIEEKVSWLAFRLPWVISRYKRMIMETTLERSEIQKGFVGL